MIFEEVMILRQHFKSQITFEEAIELFYAVLNTPEGAVVEVGSATGGTTIILIGAAEQVGKMVYSIDPYPEWFEGIAAEYTPGLMRSFRAEFKKNILDGPWKNIIQHDEDVSTCVNKIPDNLSLVFIDSCHELSLVQNEIKFLFPKLCANGLMYIHDVTSKIGQLSNTVEGGLFNINNFFIDNKEMFLYSNIKNIEFLSGRRILCIHKMR
jgi:predicted O-methyltransferase YrrM